MKRGDIYFIQTAPTTGSEQRAGRPAVIVSNDYANEHSEVVEVVYLTTQPKTDLPTHILTRSATQPSTILCEQINSVSKQRIGDYVGTLNDKEIQQLNIALTISLGLDINAVELVREPTEAEMAKIRESVKAELMATMEPPKAEPKTSTSQAIKIKTERDLYKKFSEDLLEILKGGATTQMPNYARE
jgi:mRNA interferase MazF